MNKETKLALLAGMGTTWKLENNVPELDEESRIIDLREGRALDRGGRQQDGITPGIYNPHQGGNQKWEIEIIA